MLLYDITGEERQPLPQHRAEHDLCQLQQFGVHFSLLPGLKFSPGAEEQHGSVQQGFNWRETTCSRSEWLSQLFSNSTFESHQEESQEEMEDHESVAELLVDILYTNEVDCDLANLSSIICVPVQ